MKTLDEIGIHFQTDKASQFSRTYAKPHDYLRVMEKFFEPIRNDKIKFVEVGTGGGESMKTWLEYFPYAHIYGIDTTNNTNPYDTPNSGVNPRYTFNAGNQNSEVFWQCFVATYGPEFDVLVDDGSHYASDIITTFNCMWPHIKSGGLVIIEDLSTSYAGPPFTSPDAQTQMDFIKAMLDAINLQERSIKALHFSRELAIVVKA